MLQSSTLAFLCQLKTNNNKEWFDLHRKEYELAKSDFEGFVSELLQALVPLEPALREQQAKDCTYRIFRDVRFSKDKTPYKGHFGAFFARGGRKWDGAGYYLHLEPGAIFAGGGLWMPEPSLLKKVRQEIDYDFDTFKAIVEDRTFKKLFGKLNGEMLSRPPQGYDADNPAIGFLKMKSFTAGHAMKDEALTEKTALKNVVSVFNTLSPLISFLNRAQEA
jgi:uncharacterized protein (TIGR02453 family)